MAPISHGALRDSFVTLLILFSSSWVYAQSGTSSALTGTVRDLSGAVIVRAQVSTVDVDTKAVRNTQSDAEGRFLFPQINPGNYQVKVEALGFAIQTSQVTAIGVG